MMASSRRSCWKRQSVFGIPPAPPALEEWHQIRAGQKIEKASPLKASLASIQAAATGKCAVGHSRRSSVFDHQRCRAKNPFRSAAPLWTVVYINQPRRTRGKRSLTSLRWATHEGQADAEKQHHAPLPERTRRTRREKPWRDQWANRKDARSELGSEDDAIIRLRYQFRGFV